MRLHGLHEESIFRFLSHNEPVKLQRIVSEAGFAAGLARADFSTPDHKQKILAVQLAYRRADGQLNLMIDSTGIQFIGDGEWQARKDGIRGRRQWRKVHLAMDTATSDIRAVKFTASRDGAAQFCRACCSNSPCEKTSATCPQMVPTTQGFVIQRS